jgi:hypothetical protein
MDKTGKRWRVGFYKSANDHLADVVTSQRRGEVQLVVIEGDPAQAVSASEPLPGACGAERAAAIARLAVDVAMTK